MLLKQTSIQTTAVVCMGTWRNACSLAWGLSPLERWQWQTPRGMMWPWRQSVLQTPSVLRLTRCSMPPLQTATASTKSSGPPGLPGAWDHQHHPSGHEENVTHHRVHNVPDDGEHQGGLKLFQCRVWCRGPLAGGTCGQVRQRNQDV